MTRIMTSKRDTKSGALYHDCPLLEMRIQPNACAVCDHNVKLERLKANYRQHCDFPIEGPTIRQLDFAKADQSIGGYEKNRMLEVATHSRLERKMDGVRCHYHNTDEGNVMTTRRVNKYGTYSHIESKLVSLRDDPKLNSLPGYWVFDGELTSGTLGSAMSIIGAGDDIANLKQVMGNEIKYTIYDLLFINGEDVRHERLQVRLEMLEQLRPLITTPGKVEIIEGIESVDIPTRRGYLAQIYSEGGEGLIIKNLGSTYGGSKSWLKVKQSTAMDAQVTGWKWGAVGSKYEEQLGSVSISVTDVDSGELREIADVAPGDEDTRSRLTSVLTQLEDVSDLRLIAEVEAQGWGANYRLRHPRILRWRTDLSEPESVNFNRLVRI